jgi:hypothetical protein
VVRQRRRSTLEQRVAEVAEVALAERKVVGAVDVLVGLGWLPRRRVDEWRQGRVEYLEGVTQANPSKLSAAMASFRGWAKGRGLEPSETAYVARTRDHRPLRFTESGDARIELAYRTQWVSPDLSDKRRGQLMERLSRPPDLVVISAIREWTCTECGGSGDLLLMEGPGPLCLRCAEMDHLGFLPSGEAALTRRARKASGLSAVVVRFSRARRRYERQGVLVEEAALERAEAECLADEEARSRRRLREQARRAEEDLKFQAEMAREIGRLYPGCPAERAREIARHAGARGSGRVGRTAPGRGLDREAVALAVAASVRHRDTCYDQLLMSGTSRAEARARVRADVSRVLDGWRASAG